MPPGSLMCFDMHETLGHQSPKGIGGIGKSKMSRYEKSSKCGKGNFSPSWLREFLLSPEQEKLVRFNLFCGNLWNKRSQFLPLLEKFISILVSWEVIHE